jgi:hypothetical protein
MWFAEWIQSYRNAHLYLIADSSVHAVSYKPLKPQKVDELVDESVFPNELEYYPPYCMDIGTRRIDRLTRIHYDNILFTRKAHT